MPVSETLKQKSARPLSSGLVFELKVTEPPRLLYLMLLSNRLIMICRIWVGLPIMYGPVAYGRLLSCMVMQLLGCAELAQHQRIVTELFEVKRHMFQC